MNVRRAKWLALAGAALLLAGCTLAATPGSSTSPLAQPAVATAVGPAQAPAPAATPTANGVAITGIPSDLLNAVLEDASQRTGLAVDALLVTRAEARRWNDGALGCPQPGMFYTQALVDGYQIIIEAAGELLDYRAGDQQYFRICPIAQGGAANP